MKIPHAVIKILEKHKQCDQWLHQTITHITMNISMYGEMYGYAVSHLIVPQSF